SCGWSVITDVRPNRTEGIRLSPGSGERRRSLCCLSLCDGLWVLSIAFLFDGHLLRPKRRSDAVVRTTRLTRLGHRTARQARRLCSDCITRSTRLHVFVQHHQHPGQKKKHRGNNGMTPKHEGHPKDCNDESNQCHPATSK